MVDYLRPALLKCAHFWRWCYEVINVLFLSSTGNSPAVHWPHHNSAIGLVSPVLWVPLQQGAQSPWASDTDLVASSRRTPEGCASVSQGYLVLPDFTNPLAVLWLSELWACSPIPLLFCQGLSMRSIPSDSISMSAKSHPSSTLLNNFWKGHIFATHTNHPLLRPCTN